MARNIIKPAQSLYRFMFGIYDYYIDRGMPKKTAKAKMMDNSLETAVSIIKKEEEVPDEMLVIMAQWMSRALNNRGAQITKEIKEIEQNSNPQALDTEKLLKPLRDIKPAKDAMDTFIENYTGWSELNGKKE